MNRVCTKQSLLYDLLSLLIQGNRKERGRFDPVIRALLDTALPSTQSACLLFINSVRGTIS